MSKRKHRGMGHIGLLGLFLSLSGCGDSPPDYAGEWVERFGAECTEQPQAMTLAIERVESEKESGYRARGMVWPVPAVPGTSDVATVGEGGRITFYFGGEPSDAYGYESTRLGQLTFAKVSGDENTMLLTDMRVKVMDNAGANETIDFFTVALDQALSTGVVPQNFYSTDPTAICFARSETPG